MVNSGNLSAICCKMRLTTRASSSEHNCNKYFLIHTNVKLCQVGECEGGYVPYCGQHCPGQSLGHRQGEQVHELREAQQGDEVRSIISCTFVFLMLPFHF